MMTWLVTAVFLLLMAPAVGACYYGEKRASCFALHDAFPILIP